MNMSDTDNHTVSRAQGPHCRAFLQHSQAMGWHRLRDLFTADPKRGGRLHVEAVALYEDDSKQGVNDETLRVLPALADRLTMHSLGALVKVYEHSVFVPGVIWNVDSVDQWGVELGKQLVKQAQAELASVDAPELDHNSSTNALIRHYRGRGELAS